MWIPNVGDMVLIDSSEDKYRVFHCIRDNGYIRLGVIEAKASLAHDYVFELDEFQIRVQPAPALADLLLDPATRLDAERFRLAIEALRLRYAHLIDPFHAINIAQIDLLPHQADAVYRHILPQPRIRFLLADDPGLVKTIMAGLVLKELKARGAVERILIVVPAHLRDQWKREMSDWFDEDFLIFDSQTQAKAKNFLNLNKQIITSLDFAKREPNKSTLMASEDMWDIVVFDEAHKLSAKFLGNKYQSTKRYELAREILGITNHALFLTATPHNGNDTEYWLRLNLLEPSMFANENQMSAAAAYGDGIPFVLRRSKDQVTDIQGQRLFKARTVETLELTMSPPEHMVYEAVTDYVHYWYPSSDNLDSGAEKIRKFNIALALTVLQRRVTSGMAAIRLSLERRRRKLAALLIEWEKHKTQQEVLLKAMTSEDLSELDDRLLAEWDELQETIEATTAAEDTEELKEEIAELKNLIGVIGKLEHDGNEPKLAELRRVISGYLQGHPEEKLLIFSEFKDTVLALKSHLEGLGMKVAVIHGGMKMMDRRKQEQYFRDAAQIMVATDAAAEGINLQFCRLMVNYDLPWNPNRLEQRMGRIHRYGQDRDCFIWNLLYQDTREGRILSRLLSKIESMKARPELGETIYDVVSSVLSGVSLEQLIMEAILTGDMTKVDDVIDVQLEQRVNEFIALLEENALAANYINLSEVQALHECSERQQIIRDVHLFVDRVTNWMGGGLPKDGRDGVYVLGIPTGKQAQFNGTGFEQAMKVAFDRGTARLHKDVTYLTIGQPILNRMIDGFALDDWQPRVSVLQDPDGLSGMVCLYRMTVQDGHGRTADEQLVAAFAEATEKVDLIDIRKVRDLRAVGPDRDSELVMKIEKLETLAQTCAMSKLKDIRAGIEARRSQEADLKRKWLERSYAATIKYLEPRLSELRLRQQQGERNLGGAITNAENRLSNVRRQQEARLELLAKDVTLTSLAPKLEALALVIGNDGAG